MDDVEPPLAPDGNGNSRGGPVAPPPINPPPINPPPVKRSAARRGISPNEWFSLGISALVFVMFSAFGAVLFFSSSLEYDFMKMRGMPIYGNASTIADFSGDVREMRLGMAENDKLVRDAIEARAVIDLRIAQQQIREQIAVSNAKADLLAGLSANQKLSLKDMTANYSQVDAAYRLACGQLDAGAVNERMAALPGTSVSGATTPGLSATAKGVATLKLPPALEPQLCAPPMIDCDHLVDAQKGISQVKMRCEELQLQTLNSLKTMTADYGYDTSKVLYDLLRVSYPDFDQDQVGHAEKVIDAYLAISPKAVKLMAACDRADKAAGTVTECDRHGPDTFWDKLLGWPLVVSYIFIIIMFGVLGRLIKYYFDYATPEKENPDYSLIYPVIAGGSSALLVFIACTAGFQFLAGAGGPDLAYPNPLTVCGLGLVAGIGADSIITAMGKFIEKFAPGN